MKMPSCGCYPHGPREVEMIERIHDKLWECPECGSRIHRNLTQEEMPPYLREHGTLNIRVQSLATRTSPK